ncbi:MAG: PEP-CTERM sorting domain-containing protein [Phycisphaerales bacterium]
MCAGPKRRPRAGSGVVAVRAALVAGAAAFGFVGAPCFAQPLFQGLGDLPGGLTRSFARAISADGSTVVGESSSAKSGLSESASEAFRWTESGGMAGLGDLGGGIFHSVAYATSGDGSAVVGFGSTDTASAEGFHWDTGGMVAIGNMGAPPFLGTYSIALGITPDGSQVCGSSSYYDPGPPEVYGFYAIRYVPSTGIMTPVGTLGSFGTRIAYAISPDGLYLTGLHDSNAALWPPGGGVVGLGDLPGGADSSIGWAISGAGPVVVGGSSSDNSGFFGNEAFRWTGPCGMVALGDLPDPPFGSFAHGVSNDGQVVVGIADAGAFGGTTPHAFIWNPRDGMRFLQTVLTDLGLGPSLEGWTLISAAGVTPDGRTIAGYGFRPSGYEAFRARVPAYCRADCTADGSLSVADFGCFQGRYVLGHMYADCNEDCALTVADFGCFQGRYVLGCP